MNVSHNSSNKLLIADISTQNVKHLGNVDIIVHLRIITIVLLLKLWVFHHFMFLSRGI